MVERLSPLYAAPIDTSLDTRRVPSGTKKSRVIDGASLTES
jgi:hypothetical protein